MIDFSCVCLELSLLRHCVLIKVGLIYTSMDQHNYKGVWVRLGLTRCRGRALACGCGITLPLWLLHTFFWKVPFFFFTFFLFYFFLMGGGGAMALTSSPPLHGLRGEKAIGQVGLK